MHKILTDIKYTATHEWVKDNGDNTFNMGITDYAQQQLGDVVFVELPKVGSKITQGSELCIIESVKAASDVYAPLDLEIIAVNDLLADKPELINNDCYQQGYLITFTTTTSTTLLNNDEYDLHINSD